MIVSRRFLYFPISGVHNMQELQDAYGLRRGKNETRYSLHSPIHSENNQLKT
jgi:hypothetical protein